MSWEGKQITKSPFWLFVIFPGSALVRPIHTQENTSFALGTVCQSIRQTSDGDVPPFAETAHPHVSGLSGHKGDSYLETFPSTSLRLFPNHPNFLRLNIGHRKRKHQQMWQEALLDFGLKILTGASSFSLCRQPFASPAVFAEGSVWREETWWCRFPLVKTEVISHYMTGCCRLCKHLRITKRVFTARRQKMGGETREGYWDLKGQAENTRTPFFYPSPDISNDD